MPGRALFEVAVDLFAMSDPDDGDEQDFVPDLIDCAVVLPWSQVDTIELFFGFHECASRRARLLFQAEQVAIHPLADVRIELADLLLGGRRDLNAIVQA